MAIGRAIDLDFAFCPAANGANFRVFGRTKPLGRPAGAERTQWHKNGSIADWDVSGPFKL